MIVIPMAGMSSRFFKAGYDVPKYMLQCGDNSLFDLSVRSFSDYFETESFLFIAKSSFETPKFIRERCQALGIKQFSVVVLDEDTRGQAETVYKGLAEVDNDTEITIFNIDTFRPHFKKPRIDNCQGYLEVFEGSGDNWSYAKPESETTTRVTETAEKRQISNLCSTGLYYFESAGDFKKAFEIEAARPPEEWDKAELYVAPLYNHLIKLGKAIHYNLIEREDVIFCGVPDEYTDFCAKYENQEVLW